MKEQSPDCEKEDFMKKRMSGPTGTLSVASVLVALALSAPSGAWAQEKVGSVEQQLEGTWRLVSTVNIKDDGTRADAFGANPKGILMFGRGGRFAVVNMRAELPKFASGNRMQGTPEENKAIVQGSIALFGSYSVDAVGKVITLSVESSTWPSWTGADQKRSFTLSGDELKWTLPAPIGGTAEIVWKRLK
jgi:Lipocalin-like domain